MEFPNYLSIYIFPIYYLSVSTILIDIGSSIGASPGDLGLIFTFYPAGAIVGQLTSVFYNTKFTKMQIFLVSYLLLIPISIALSFSRSLIMFFILYTIAGYILGVVWVQANENILESKIKNKDRLMTVALTFYPLGAFTAPFIASLVVNSAFNWQFLYYILIILIVLIAILYYFLMRNRKDKILTEKREKIDLKKIFHLPKKNIMFLLIALGAFFYSIGDTSFIIWSPTFFRIERFLDVKTAGYVIAIFWIGIIVGRMVLMPFLGKIRANLLLLILTLFAIIFTSYSIFAPTGNQIFIGMGLAGMGYSALFPLFMSSGSTVYKKGKGVLLTIMYASAYTGKTIAPFLTRFISRYNMTFSLLIAIIFLGISLILVSTDIYYEKR